jgi:hypothetical protein
MRAQDFRPRSGPPGPACGSHAACATWQLQRLRPARRRLSGCAPGRAGGGHGGAAARAAGAAAAAPMAGAPAAGAAVAEGFCRPLPPAGSVAVYVISGGRAGGGARTPRPRLRQTRARAPRRRPRPPGARARLRALPRHPLRRPHAPRPALPLPQTSTPTTPPTWRSWSA